MAQENFILWYRLELTDRYAIWYSENEANSNGVVLNAVGQIAHFGSVAQVKSYAASIGVPLQQELPGLHDLDVVNQWLNAPRKRTVNCVEILNSWNLFDDVARSVQDPFDPDRLRTAKTYRKLLWGNNLPSMTPIGKCYEPIWTKSEVGIMQHILGSGLSTFRRHLAY